MEKEQLREEGRQEVLDDRLVTNNIWEGRFVFKKKFIMDYLDYNRLKNLSLRAYLFNQISEHKREYVTPGVVCLLDTFNIEANI